jgi:O-antigen/teichoic acid export membrane protein
MSDISNKKILINNTLWVYAGKIISQLLGLLATVLVIRKLPVDIYGTYLFIFGLFFIYQIFITSPVKNLLIRYIPELVENNNFSLVKRVLLNSVVLSYILIGVFTIILYNLKDVVGEFFNIDHFPSHLYAFNIFVFCYALKVLSEAILASVLKHKVSAQANVFVVIFRGSSYLFLLNSIHINLLLYIEAVGALIYTFYAIWHLLGLFRDWKKNYKEELPDDTVYKRILRFYFLSFFSELGYGIVGRTSDQYIIAAQSSPLFVGLYGFALKIFEMFYKVLPFREFESVLKPVFFKRYSKSSSADDLNQFYQFTLNVLMPLFMLPFLYFLFFGESIIIHVFEDKYLPAYNVTLVILLSIIVNGLFYALSFVIHLKERVEIVLYSRLIMVISIVVSVWMMQLFGIIGVAATTLVGEFIASLLMLWMLKKYVVIKYQKKMFVRYGALLAIMFILFFPLKTIFMSWEGLIAGSVTFGLVYFLLLINIHPLSKEELKKLENVFTSSDKIKKLYVRVQPLFRYLVLRKMSC